LLHRFDNRFLRRDSAAQDWHPLLRESCRSLAANASRILIGICASNAETGLAILKAWTAELALPKGKLFGMDIGGVPIPPPPGAVYIKYNSDTGDARISKYSGDYRGVLFSPQLPDGNFRQFGHLPLNQWQELVDAANLARAESVESASTPDSGTLEASVSGIWQEWNRHVRA
jgi:hypothetical protein